MKVHHCLITKDAAAKRVARRRRKGDKGIPPSFVDKVKVKRKIKALDQ